jgi:hypothetical protein
MEIESKGLSFRRSLTGKSADNARWMKSISPRGSGRDGPIGNWQLEIGNAAIHPLPRGGTDCCPRFRFRLRNSIDDSC